MTRLSEKVEFEGSQGARLAARLELPAGEIRAYALFAHCFSCSKDTPAASRVSRMLAERGVAVLRFDFTGLGSSDGDFASTDFSSNVQDLLEAADFLRRDYEAPRLLIGHSLGGAAVLAAAGDIPEARAVATIAAPAHADHVIRNFGVSVEEIERTGEAQVELAGRSFTIRKSFLDNVRAQDVRQRISALKRPLIVFHAPRDEVVGIENAAEIFEAAKHPKSFVSLDDADHLLTRRTDAVYVADVLSAWAERYVSLDGQAAEPDGPPDAVRVSETGEGTYQQKVTSGRHSLLADEPQDHGGLDSGPSPYDFLSIALGACTSMTLRMYADRKGYALGRIAVEVSHAKVHAEDCRDCGEGREGRIDRFERSISIEGALPEGLDADKILEIAGKCPVHKTLEKSSAIVTALAGGDGD
ncbi:alpha/beta fold hydrolase [Kaustia mangrovi]|uniref:Alpha/beta fold hydrolase n=1 Tax=Kaustia mangrovi TaxID=2593653 RepID=A0A7S8HAV3_9HYPH|nr:bifunctional alpha/beta hydrolase/OsmC family protein [Kaustia mangrovi]QPC41970.1 alpha/beta fold hydrolase [Kaustia mangrovi]